MPKVNTFSYYYHRYARALFEYTRGKGRPARMACYDDGTGAFRC